MPIFRCRVVDRKGRTSVFVREALSEAALILELNREEIFPLEVVESREESSSPPKLKKLSRPAVLELASTLALLLSSGLTFRDCLEVAQTTFLKGPVNQLVSRLLEEIRKGRSLSQALEELQGGFPPLFKAFIRIGEKIGSLEATFKQLVTFLTDLQKLRDRLVSSLIYPALVVGVAVVGIGGIVTIVLPRVEQMFRELGGLLPVRIESMIRFLNGSLIAVGILVAVALLSGFVMFLIRRRNPTAASRLDRLLLRIPLLGRITYLAEMMNLTFALETLCGGGFSVEEALQEAATVVANRAIRAGVLEVREALIKGVSLSVAFRENPVFSPRIGRWVAVGERSGQVEQVFAQLRRFHQGEMEKWTSRFMNLIEPALILLVGVLILFIVFFFITPIFSIYEGLL
jgi:type II secretory pathway component PulF